MCNVAVFISDYYYILTKMCEHKQVYNDISC